MCGISRREGWQSHALWCRGLPDTAFTRASQALRLAGELARLSTDQTLVQLLVDKGELPADRVATHPFRNVVLRSVNGDEPVEPALRDLDLEAGDRLLLCSDGLTDFVPEPEIVAALATPDPDEAAHALIGLALAAGGRDNVTCLVADLVDGPEVNTVGRLLGAMMDPRLVVDPAAIHTVTP